MTIKIDFNKFDKAGLKSVVKLFEKSDLHIEDIEATNKAKRESGYPVKTATFTFSSGQKLQVKAKADGGVYQVKLNNKVIPIKAADKIDEAVTEVISAVKANEPLYLKQQAKKEGKVIVPKIKTVNTSLAAQIKTLTGTVDEMKAAAENIQTQITAAAEQTTQLTGQADGLAKQLADEKAKTGQLQAQIDLLKTT